MDFTYERDERGQGRGWGATGDTSQRPSKRAANILILGLQTANTSEQTRNIQHLHLHLTHHQHSHLHSNSLRLARRHRSLEDFDLERERQVSVHLAVLHNTPIKKAHHPSRKFTTSA